MEEKEIIDNGQDVNESEQGNEYQQYIDTINDLKRNTVPKEKYKQLEKEKEGLIEALKSGNQINLVEEQEEESIDELRKDLFVNLDKPMKDVEYVDKMLKLRKKLIDQGEKDPFLPNDENYNITQQDIDTANFIAQTYAECVEYANGDNNLFMQELMRRTKDDSPIQKARSRN